MTFSLSGSPLIRNIPPNQILGIPNIGSQKGQFRVTPTFFRSEVDILQILQTVDLQGMLPIPAWHFKILTQCWSLGYFGINKMEFAEYFLLISATLLRVPIFCFLKEYVPRSLCVTHKRSSIVSAYVQFPRDCQP